MSPASKKKFVNKHNFCKTCLYNLKGLACFSTKRGRECTGYHNTIFNDAFTQSASKSQNGTVAIKPSFGIMSR